ncbi:CoA-transferase family III domain-containing protein [Coniella lustricola]|uniref:CoA-transferase family III domain-containing protein n=1 Tax=Coniella lustricola TaxID=2025994 RepID=A0A2T3AII5_9PEZI|nr:CoA-transferase family III domain-containing protein [Coniella lustricola]
MTNLLADYSVPAEAKRVFENGILHNPLVQRYLPAEAAEAAKHITFEGSDKPSLPINWRFAESISALKAYEATVLNVLLQRKYGVDPVQIKINTDHAQLFIMSTLVWQMNPDKECFTLASYSDPKVKKAFEKYFPDCDKHNVYNQHYRDSATNIYRTKNGSFFHLHGSMNPGPTFKSVGLPPDMNVPTMEDSWAPFQEAVGRLTAKELQHLATDVHRQAGTICNTVDEFRESEHGRANADVGLFTIHSQPNAKQQPCWWADAPEIGTSVARPLAGLKVVDLTRIIAAPVIARGLAELGASVMRVTAPHITDMSALHPDLNHGKWNASLDLRQEEDRETLRGLIREADVVVQGYRPGVLDKYGFSQQNILDLCKDRERGLIYARENCYGWQGPWMHRSGWQQISDANCGVSYEFGRAMGNNEPVTPVFPNSDYCTGVCGIAAILTALIQRAEKGGSYSIDTALNYYSRWLVDHVGTYSNDVWQDVWKRNGSPVFRHYHNMNYSIPRVLQAVQKSSGAILFQPEFFTQYHPKHIGVNMKIVAPVLNFPGGEVKPGFHVGTRGNGVDRPQWPADLSVEVVE